MKSLKLISIVIALLVISLPICFADTINVQTDTNGNVINDGVTREYNGLNQLVRIKNSTDGKLVQEFIHHPTEERIYIKKEYNQDGSLKEKTIYVNKNSVLKINDSGEYEYTFVYHNGQLVSQELSGEKLFMHDDVIGSTNAVSNSSGDLVETTTTSPFGEVVSGGTVTDRNYEAKEYDSVVQDTDFHFRKYKQDWGLFTQPDTLIQNVYDPQSLNRYSFERNNPYRYKDPSGHSIGGAIEGGALFADISIIGSYNDLIEINVDPALESELINQRAKAIATLAIVQAFKKYINPVASSALTSYGIKSLSDYKKRVALANPQRYVEFIDQLVSDYYSSSQYNVMSSWQKYQIEKLYFPAGVDIRSLATSSNLFSTYGGSSSVLESMQHTSISGAGINWYYNPNTGHYTYRVDGTSPGKEWTDGSSNGGSSGGGGGGSSGCTTNCYEDLGCITVC